MMTTTLSANRSRRKLLKAALAGSLIVSTAGWRAVQASQPVVIGIDAEFRDPTSTSATAIRLGVETAIKDINAAGGVLNGRPLVALALDNRSLPARGLANVRQFAATPNLVGYLCGKFSPVTLEQLPLIHTEEIILLNPWSAADGIIDNGYEPNYAFRVGLRDSWAMAALIEGARERNIQRIGFLFPRSAWGRSCRDAAERYLNAHPGLIVAATEWHTWGDGSSIGASYAAIQASGAEAMILVANEPEGAEMVRSIAARPASERLPVFSHWGITGGAFPELCGPDLQEVDLSVVQTFSFGQQTHPEARMMAERAKTIFQTDDALGIHSVAGFAHAYDLTRLIALATDQAGTTDRPAIREALLNAIEYRGIVRHYAPAFAPGRHEALDPASLFLARFDHNGRLLPITR